MMGDERRRRSRAGLILAALLVSGSVASCDSATDDDRTLTEITVLFAFSPAVADSMGNPTTFVEQAVRETNAVYRDGNIPIRLVPVHLMEVHYPETSARMVLGRLVDPADGAMDEIHPARDQSEADVVVLISPDRSATINASIMAVPENAFVIVWFGALGDPFYGMAHELAHLHGARHDAIRDPVDEPFPYGHGFRNDTLKTIMGGGPGTLVPRFSGPDQVYEGVVLGDSSTADVARVLRETAVYVSNFRGPQTQTDFVPVDTWPTLP